MRLGHLSDPAQFHEALALPAGECGWLVDSLERMLLIRTAEEKIGDMVAQGKIRCPCHLAIGQEAPAVAVARHVRSGDRLFGAHRSHAHYLALGGSLRGLLAEVQGKATGTSGGMGGSMHLLDVENGLLGTVPIVGATIPMAVGAALAAKMDRSDSLAVSFLGDGATEEGIFHESLNFASVMRLPVLFVCENNLFSSHMHINLRQPNDSVSRFAEAHGINWKCVEGNDVVALDAAASQAFAAIRAGEGPLFLEAVTYRWRGHVGPREDEDVGVKRGGDLDKWKRRDPIGRLAAALIERNVLSSERYEQLQAAARAEVEQTWLEATADPYPPPEALLGHVYSGAR